jgi:2-polyprenyl-6-methoxyphenol hydroxylase-like FAD-dependent oxidoreductase
MLTGAAMSFSHNVAPAMIQLGIYDEFLQISKTMASMDLFQEQSTEGAAQDAYDEPQLQAAQVGTDSEVVPLTTVHFAQMTAMTGYPIRIFPRPKFFELLLSRLPAHKIHLDKKIVNVTQDLQEDGVDGITIHCADETTYRGDILVGADGAYSAVRRSIYKQAAAENKLPAQDLENLNLGYVTMVGTTDPLDLKMFPEVEDNACLHFRTVGQNKPHTVS